MVHKNIMSIIKGGRPETILDRITNSLGEKLSHLPVEVRICERFPAPQPGYKQITRYHTEKTLPIVVEPWQEIPKLASFLETAMYDVTDFIKTQHCKDWWDHMTCEHLTYGMPLFVAELTLPIPNLPETILIFGSNPSSYYYSPIKLSPKENRVKLHLVPPKKS